MWFRLKRGYRFRKGEIHFDSWRMAGLKAGAPIHTTPELGLDKARTPCWNFVFGSGGLRHLSLKQLILPFICEKDRMGNVFCAKTRQVFVSIAHYGTIGNGQVLGEMLASQLVHCPLCGQQLGAQAEYPYDEKVEDYEIKRSQRPSRKASK